MSMTHLSAPAEIAANLRRRADQNQPAFSTADIIEASFPGIVVAGHDGDPALVGMLMRACGHVILYQRDLSFPEQRVRIAHALAHLIYDGDGRVASCTFNPEAEARAWHFVDELLVPFTDLARHVYRWPPIEQREMTIYRDQCDMLASRFAVPARLIDKRIRDLQKSSQNM
jgi:Zn-dependent peptidase ImmA (M78 family)